MTIQATEPPSADDLKEGIRLAVESLLYEASLGSAVGESGHIRIHLDVPLDKGRVRGISGAVYFERKFRLKE